ncbi:hypothetical protein JM79_2737 [Gramella sp. Hel_I_59]|uniref:hypothetical protein n=1 Tax=Gramella sp. Hel_I_59 TaxID=1249978 RepID=UPI00114D52F7|nr:hypothetical protein [Gramella sp. Hel_I_59]TQI71788.1 hypothetical protein JM79_2737 [Gramella sp. Hel_I_59]
MEIRKFKDLKEFVNSLNENQLEQPVKFWGDEIGGEIHRAEVLKEDWINPTGDGLEPRSAYDDEPEYEFEPAGIEKGSPVLSISQE